ncbi:hypothetical protein Hanom_Chr06g00489261 [Helianthus anomalus]
MTMTCLRRLYHGRCGGSSILDAVMKSYEAVAISPVQVTPFFQFFFTVFLPKP